MSDLINSLSRNLRGYWCPMLQYGGLTLMDQTRFKNHGVLTNMDVSTDWVMSRVKGRSGRVLDFDGTNDHIPITNFRSVPTQNRLTSNAWIRFAGTASRIEIVHFIGSNSINNAFFLYRNASGRLVSEFGNGTASATGTTTISGGVWNLLTATYDGAFNRVYLNGVLEASTSHVNANISKQQIIISAYYMDNSGGTTPLLPLIGQHAESCVWNRALSPVEIQELYRLGPGWYQPQLPRRFPYSEQQAEGFKAYWARRQSQLIGGGV